MGIHVEHNWEQNLPAPFWTPVFQNKISHTGKVCHWILKNSEVCMHLTGFYIQGKPHKQRSMCHLSKTVMGICTYYPRQKHITLDVSAPKYCKSSDTANLWDVHTWQYMYKSLFLALTHLVWFSIEFATRNANIRFWVLL